MAVQSGKLQHRRLSAKASSIAASRGSTNRRRATSTSARRSCCPPTAPSCIVPDYTGPSSLQDPFHFYFCLSGQWIGFHSNRAIISGSTRSEWANDALVYAVDQRSEAHRRRITNRPTQHFRRRFRKAFQTTQRSDRQLHGVATTISVLR